MGKERDIPGVGERERHHRSWEKRETSQELGKERDIPGVGERETSQELGKERTSQELGKERDIPGVGEREDITGARGRWRHHRR